MRIDIDKTNRPKNRPKTSLKLAVFNKVNLEIQNRFNDTFIPPF